jgi:rhodanese-related sulfurtransferase
MKNDVILGSGTCSEIFLNYLTEQGFNIVDSIDDNEKSWEKNIHSLAVLSGFKT